MATRDEYFSLLGRMAAVRTRLAEQLSSERPADVSARSSLTDQLATLETDLQGLLTGDHPLPADGGIGAIIGIGPDAAAPFGGVPTPIGVPSYNEAVVSERLYAVGDLYYCYQMERLGMFRAVQKLKELFRAGKLRLGGGTGAFDLYRFDRKEVLRYTHNERMQAYRRVLGYTDAAPPKGARANHAFHNLFSQFNLSVAELFRDKRIAETFRPGSGATDPSFGSVATVRRRGLDFRSNLKNASYGDVNVLTIELLQVISSAFDILQAPDIRHQVGAADGWEMLEEVLERYLGEAPAVSQRSRMAETGRGIIHWLAQGYIVTPGRTAFEALIQNIAEKAEEWIASAQALSSVSAGTRDASASGNILEFPAGRRATL